MLAIAFFFPPDGGSGSLRNVKILKYLPELGWDLRVLTHEDQSQDGRDNHELKKEIPTGCRVIRTRFLNLQLAVNSLIRAVLPRRKRAGSGSSDAAAASASMDETSASAVTPGEDKSTGTSPRPSLFRRTVDFVDRGLAIPDRFIGWFPFALRAALREMRRERADVIYAVGKPWTGLLVGYLVKLLCRRPLVVDLMDPWTVKSWNPSKNGRLFLWIDRQLERFVLRRSDYVIANTAPLRQDIMNRLRIDGSRVGVITCGFDGDDFGSRIDPAAANGLDRKNGLPFTVTHTGTFYGRRSPLPFLKAAKRLVDSAEVPGEHLRINLIGRISIRDPELDRLLADPAMDSVVHTENWVPHSSVLDYLYASHLLLLVQPEAWLQIPAKLYEYAATRRPVMALCEAEGAVEHIMRAERWGDVVNCDDVDGIAISLLRAYRGHLEENGTRLLGREGVERYTTRALATRLALMLDATAGPRRRTTETATTDRTA